MKYISLILLFTFFSCYNEKKAIQQVARADAAYPEIIAKLAAKEYPIKETFLPGDTITVRDTLKLEGNVITDTLITFDTVRIRTIITLPGKTITTTIYITDTVKQESTSKLAACEIERGKTLDLLASANLKLTDAQGKAKTRGIWMWSLIALIVVYSGWKVYNIVKPKTV